MIPSQRQQDVFDTWRNEDCNILISAVAGSGKTTTLLELLSICDDKTLFLAFNKSVQEEIQNRIEAKKLGQGKSMTLHSLGLKAISRVRNVKINTGKNFELIKELQKKHKTLFRGMKWEDKLKISYTLMDMHDISRLFLTEEIDELQEHFLSLSKSFYKSEKLELVWEKFLELRNERLNDKVVDIDFIDMIFLPVIYELPIPIDPVYLMIDEAQDLNLCQHLLIDMLIAQNTIKKWIAVGDRNQAIYGFSGAYSSSFERFLNKGNVKELPLDICYRCDKSIIDEANAVYPVMEYGKLEIGSVKTTQYPSEIKQNSMVICRNSSPLIELYFNLIGMNKPCYIKGDDIMNSVLRFLKSYSTYSIFSAKREMFYKLEDLSKIKDTEKGRIEYYYFKENFTNFKHLSKHLCDEHDKISTLVSLVKNLFKKTEGAIMLCTIHKSKGLEAEVVYILNENLIPSKFATSAEQLKQEQNLKYVARTRAKKELYYLNL